MAENDGGEMPRPVQSDGAYGARSKHGALACREYDILSSEATEGGHANAGGVGREEGHGALENQEGSGTAEEWDKTSQCALPVQEPSRRHTEARAPPARLRALNACGRREEKGGRDPPPQRAPMARSGGMRGHPNTAAQDTPRNWAQEAEGGPHLQ